MSTFTNAIAREIESRFNNGEPFSKFHLVSIANTWGKNDRSITHVLRDMNARGELRIIGEVKNPNFGGTRASKIYARVSETVVPKPGYRKGRSDKHGQACQREAYLNQCGIRLHQVLDGMTRARMQSSNKVVALGAELN